MYLKYVQLINIFTDAYIDINEIHLFFDTTLILPKLLRKPAMKKQKNILATLPNFVKGR